MAGAQTCLGFIHEAPRSAPRGRNVSSARKPARRAGPALALQTQLSFDSGIDGHRSAQERLQQTLARLLREQVALHITDNQRTMISCRRGAEGLELRLHHMFLHADPSVLRALARYLKRRERRASARLGEFIDAERHRIRRRPRSSASVRTAGRHHELQEVFDRLDARYFGGACDARITWGRKAAATRRRRRSIKLGRYCPEDALIRIHPALDREWVPRFFIEYVVYHEMLHHMIPPRVRNGRRELHGPEFRAHERRFPHYARALAWEQRYVHRLLKR